MVYFTPKKRYGLWLPILIIVLAALFYGYQYVLRMLPSLMSSELFTVYHYNAVSFGSMSAAFYYGYVPMQLLAGVLIDRYGPRLTLTLAGMVCVLGSFLFTLAHDLAVVEFARFLIGVGAAFAFIGLLKLSLIWLPERYFGLIAGGVTALGMLGGVVGDVTLISHLDSNMWRLTCIWVGIFGVIISLLLFTFLHDVKAKGVHTSLAHYFKSLVQMGRSKQIWLCGIIAMLLFLPMSVFAEAWGILFLKQSYDYSAVHAANLTAMLFLGWVIGAPLVGILSDKLGHTRTIVSIGATITAILAAAIFYLPGAPYITSYALFFFFGFFSSVQILMFVIARSYAPKGHSASVFGVLNFLTTLGGFVSLFVGFFLHEVHIEHGVIKMRMLDYSHVSYEWAFLVIPLSLILAVFLSMYLQPGPVLDS